MKHSTMLLLALLATLAWADDGALTPPPDKPLSASKSEVLKKRTGGFITRRYPGSSFVFADMSAKAQIPQEEIAALQEGCQIPVVRRALAGDRRPPIQVASDLLSDSSEVGGVAVLFDGAANQPVLTVFPENRITLVNTTPLAENVSAEVFQNRLIKEMWRAISYTAGGTCANTPHCVMQAILQPSDLDKIKCSMANPDVTGQIYNNARRFGFGTIVTSTYRSGCKEGGAPPPTNAYQKAIWDRFKAEKERGPSSPIQIKP